MARAFEKEHVGGYQIILSDNKYMCVLTMQEKKLNLEDLLIRVFGCLEMNEKRESSKALCFLYIV